VCWALRGCHLFKTWRKPRRRGSERERSKKRGTPSLFFLFMRRSQMCHCNSCLRFAPVSLRVYKCILNCSERQMSLSITHSGTRRLPGPHNVFPKVCIIVSSYCAENGKHCWTKQKYLFTVNCCSSICVCYQVVTVGEESVYRNAETHTHTHTQVCEYRHSKQCKDAGSVAVGGCGCLKCVSVFLRRCEKKCSN